MKSKNGIHERALAVALRFKQAEADLILILQEVESSRIFLKLGFTSLFTYCVDALGLSRDVSLNFITVARAARHIPIFQAAIQEGKLTISTARKIAPVVKSDPADWIEKAQTLTSRKLEEETLGTLLDVYLEVKDPAQRAGRVLNRKPHAAGRTDRPNQQEIK